MSWHPIRRRTPVLSGLDLRIPAGQRVLLVGPSGAGKSTLLRAIGGVLRSAGQGELTGRVLVGRRDPSGPDRVPGSVGLLLQDPSAGLVAETVGRDVAFGLENARTPRQLIWSRVEVALSQTAFPYGVDHPTAALSGGEQQRLAFAGSLVLGNQVMLLDEPTSMLDDEAARTVRDAVRRDAVGRGNTVVIVEHHIMPWLDFADRLLVLGIDGRLVADGPPREVLQRCSTELARQGVWVPGLGPPELLAVDRELVEPERLATGPLVQADQVRVDLRASLTGTNRRTRTALDGVSADLTAGRALAVTGPSGAGKSTLVAVLAGLLRPGAGTVRAGAGLSSGTADRSPWRWGSRELVSRLSWVPQLPEHGVVASTVADEVMVASRSCGRDLAWARRRADALIEVLGLGPLRSANPYRLSGGEQRRLMVAASLAHGPNGLLLDEPTVGQDRNTWAAVVGCLTVARDAGVGIALASHDAMATAASADEILRLENGTQA